MIALAKCNNKYY